VPPIIEGGAPRSAEPYQRISPPSSEAAVARVCSVNPTRRIGRDELDDDRACLHGVFVPDVVHVVTVPAATMVRLIIANKTRIGGDRGACVPADAVPVRAHPNGSEATGTRSDRHQAGSSNCKESRLVEQILGATGHKNGHNFRF
jgi:hypothetical protein